MNRAPNNAEFVKDPDFLPLGEQVVFNDGKVGILCRQAGTRFEAENLQQLGLDRHDKTDAVVRVVTSSGNRYTLSEGLLFNRRAGTVRRIGELTPIEVGAQWSLSDGSVTSRVERVFYGWPKLGDRHDDPLMDDLLLENVPDVHLNQPNPYDVTQRLVDAAYSTYPDLR